MKTRCLSAAVQLGACASYAGVPHPTDWKHVFSPVLEMAGVKSWAKFVMGASLVGIEMEDGTITFMPHRNEGAKEGFGRLEGQAIKLPADATCEQIGDAVLAAAAACA